LLHRRHRRPAVAGAARRAQGGDLPTPVLRPPARPRPPAGDPRRGAVTMQATDWLREHVAEAFSILFLLRRAVARGACDPRAVGLRNEDLKRIRLALIAAADEITQRPGSRCDYSSPPPPGEPPLLQQKYFRNTTSAGHFFFDELEIVLSGYRPCASDPAILE